MSADFAHALDDGQAAYRAAAGGDVEALAEVVRARLWLWDAETGVANGRPTYGDLMLNSARASVIAAEAIVSSDWLADLLTVQRTRTAVAIRAEADRICAKRGCHVASNDHAELMKWAGVFAGVVERGIDA